ncbi:PAS domain-containing protein [Desulfovibrio sp. OttesenSCG-928-M14]|nr:PAS domain-containing protein [Desulfovibrio sp. OttesenSCG-928-M14]
MAGDYLMLKQDNCRNCCRCIRNCPVKAISFSDNQARIVDADCVLCGRCFVSCPQQAKEIRRDLDRARALVASGRPVYASIAPSFVAYFEHCSIESLEQALLGLGFAGVEETALGAVMVKRRYDEILLEGKQNVVISTCCHSVALLVQKHFPEAVPFLAPVLSPMQAHCQDIKKRQPGATTIFIGPCISKKAEADQYPGTVDCVLTFDELADWLLLAGIKLKELPRTSHAGKTRLFPSAGGIVRSMARSSKKHTYLHIEGVENCIGALRNIHCQELDNCFIEMSACEGSCIGGPIMRNAVRAPISAFVAVNNYAGDTDFAVPDPDKGVLDKHFPLMPRCQLRVSEKALQEVLRKTGKTRPEHELNCGTCGYDTCREKAAAVVRGMADINMCLPYLKERAESFSDTIIKNSPNGVLVLNEKLVMQQINEAACRILGVEQPDDIIGEKVNLLLDPNIFIEVLQSGKNIFERHTRLSEQDRHVRMTVVRDENYHIFILIMRDVTKEENRKAQTAALNWKTVEVTDQVIEKQMRVVQEIASLLGETAAETKIALTKLKESLKGE